MLSFKASCTRLRSITSEGAWVASTVPASLLRLLLLWLMLLPPPKVAFGLSSTSTAVSSIWEGDFCALAWTCPGMPPALTFWWDCLVMTLRRSLPEAAQFGHSFEKPPFKCLLQVKKPQRMHWKSLFTGVFMLPGKPPHLWQPWVCSPE